MKILTRDSSILVIDKPARTHVHPPEDRNIRVDPATTCVGMLEREIGEKVYPIHRLDFATSGILVFALSSKVARDLQSQFLSHEVEKTYWAITRGWVDAREINRPLRADNRELTEQDALTRFSSLGRIELAEGLPPHATSRYDFVEARPVTGRRHQIRRHLAGANRPIIGDVAHGDRHHNRFFHTRFESNGLLLRAVELKMRHPATGDAVVFTAPQDPMWSHLQNAFLNKKLSELS